MQHTTNETAVAEEFRMCPKPLRIQGRDETTLLKEYDTLRSKPGRKEGNQSRL